MEEYKVSVTTKLVRGQVIERLVTVRAETVEEAEATYRKLVENLPAWRPDEVSANSENRHQTRQKAASAPSGTNVCPEHGKAREGKGGKLYCPTKLADGSWCKWRG